MFNKIYYVLFLYTLLASCVSPKPYTKLDKRYTVSCDTFNLFDAARQRKIPIARYKPAETPTKPNLPIVIFSHGYGENKGGANLAYTYLTTELATMGYDVFSIQHELATDSLLPMTGNPRQTRRSNWERGAENIRFVLNTIETQYRQPEEAILQAILIGHSNGGDMSVLFTHKYPERVAKLISLDNRRMPLPRTETPRIYTLRSSDMPADEGVLPNAKEAKKYHIKVIKLPNTIHNDMDDDGTAAQRQEINTYIKSFLAQ